MADHEQQLDIPPHQQDESAVALTTVGEPEPPMTMQTETAERDHEAVDAEQANLEQAATSDGVQASVASEVVHEEHVGTDDQAQNADVTLTNESTTSAAVYTAQPEHETTAEAVGDAEMGNEQPSTEEPKMEEHTPDQQEPNPLETELAAESTKAEPTTVSDDIVAEETVDAPKGDDLAEPSPDSNNLEAGAQGEPAAAAEAEEVDEEKAGVESGDDLFGSDDEAPKAREYPASAIPCHAQRLISHRQ